VCVRLHYFLQKKAARLLDKVPCAVDLLLGVLLPLCHVLGRGCRRITVEFGGCAWQMLCAHMMAHSGGDNGVGRLTAH
jgi:hypothetical protein